MTGVIVCLFSATDYAARPWLDNGYTVVSCDLQGHTGTTGNHIRVAMDARDLPGFLASRELEASLVLAFPPCTDLAVSGAKHFARKREGNPWFQWDAAALAVMAATDFNGAPYAIENPVSALATIWRRPDHYFNPCDYAGYIPLAESAHPEFPDVIPERDRYLKKTCIWSGNGFIMPAPMREEPESLDNPGWAKLGGKGERTKYIRSMTPRGFANAVFHANRWTI
jgi:hypothetical protein